MRRLSALSMLVVLLISWATPSIAALRSQSADDLPACCRKIGKHRCMMSMSERSRIADRAPAFSSPGEKCPYFPAIEQGMLGNLFVFPSPEEIALRCCVVPMLQTLQLRVFAEAVEGGHQKRGPPTFFF